MLSRRRRLSFLGMLVLVFIAGVLDMCGMLMIFGFIGGLHVDANGHRHGRLMKILHPIVGTNLSDHDYAIIVGSIVLGVVAFKNVLSTLVQFALNRFLMKINQRVALGLFDGYLLTPYEEILKRGVSGPTGQITNIFNTFGRCFSSISQLMADGTLILIVACVLAYINPWLTMASVVAFAAAGAVLYLVMQKTLVQMARQDKNFRDEAALHLADGIQGLVETRLRDARSVVSAAYSRALRHTSLLRRRIGALKRLPRSSNEMLLTTMIVGSVFYLMLSRQTLHGVLPTLALFGYAGLRLTSAITRINVALQGLRRKHEDFEEYYEAVAKVAPHVFSDEGISRLPTYLVDEKPLPPGTDGRLHHALTARGIAFTYPGAESPAVRGLSLEIPKGAFVGICGPSGGGKSTLVMLLLGLIRPSEGQILCDDWNIHEHIRAWHKNVGYISQKMYVAHRTIRENVAFAVPKEEIDDKRVWHALKLAAADDFVKKLPKKLGYQLKEEGSNLSGGQRQRLIIARALYDDPDVLIFDEATAALDNVTEREITRAIQNLSGTKTIVVVAHRLSTIQMSHVIFVLEEGRIVARGTYDELLRTSATFEKLVKAPTEV